MKEYLKILIYILIFGIIIAIALFGYKYLTKKYYKEDISEIENQGEKLKKATDFTVLNNDGEKIKLSSFFGKPIIVNFWATWCGPCRTELPEFESFYNQYNTEIEFLMVNLTDGNNDTVEGVKKFIKGNNYNFPVYYDTQDSASIAYKVHSIPQTLFINKEGNIIKSYIGIINAQTLEKYINELRDN